MAKKVFTDESLATFVNETKKYTDNVAVRAAYINATDNENVNITEGNTGNITVDSVLSVTSTNPVQNKVVTNKFSQLEQEIVDLDIRKVEESDLETEVENQLDGAKADIVTQIITQIGGMPVFGTVNDDNTITVTSTLADGEYVLMYENDEGTLEQIGTIVVGDGEIISYTNILDTVGYTVKLRINSSGEEVVQDGMCTTGFIPIISGQKLRVKNITVAGSKTSYIVTYNSSKSMITCWSTDKLVDDGTGIYEYTVTESTCAYIRLSIGTIDDTSIITVNEEITE